MLFSQTALIQVQGYRVTCSSCWLHFSSTYGIEIIPLSISQGSCFFQNLRGNSIHKMMNTVVSHSKNVRHTSITSTPKSYFNQMMNMDSDMLYNLCLYNYSQKTLEKKQISESTLARMPSLGVGRGKLAGRVEDIFQYWKKGKVLFYLLARMWVCKKQLPFYSWPFPPLNPLTRLNNAVDASQSVVKSTQPVSLD